MMERSGLLVIFGFGLFANRKLFESNAWYRLPLPTTFRWSAANGTRILLGARLVENNYNETVPLIVN